MFFAKGRKSDTDSDERSVDEVYRAEALAIGYDWDYALDIEKIVGRILLPLLTLPTSIVKKRIEREWSHDALPNPVHVWDEELLIRALRHIGTIALTIHPYGQSESGEWRGLVRIDKGYDIEQYRRKVFELREPLLKASRKGKFNAEKFADVIREIVDIVDDPYPTPKDLTAYDLWADKFRLFVATIDVEEPVGQDELGVEEYRFEEISEGLANELFDMKIDKLYVSPAVSRLICVDADAGADVSRWSLAKPHRGDITHLVYDYNSKSYASQRFLSEESLSHLLDAVKKASTWAD